MMAYYRVSLAVAATAMLSGAAAAAAELPTFEIIGFPLTQHQAAVLNSSVCSSRRPPPHSRWAECRRPRFRSRSCHPGSSKKSQPQW